MLIGRFIAGSTKAQTKFSVVFPSDMLSLPAVANTESEIELPTRPSPIVCMKYSVTFQNASPFLLFVDPERKDSDLHGVPSDTDRGFSERGLWRQPDPNYAPPSGP